MTQEYRWKCPENDCLFETIKPTARALGLARSNHIHKSHDKRRSGTQEWADGGNLNIYRGCRRRCRYCYRAYDDTARRKMVVDEVTKERRHLTEAEWKKMEFMPKWYHKKPKKVGGRLFCYSGHDVFPDNMHLVLDHLKMQLEVGNHILIVTKPIYECVKFLCRGLQKYKSQITWRFTIGSKRNDNLRFWDGGDLAPLYEERLDCLKHAYYQGYNTSVSCEPFFDNSIVDLVHELLPYVTDTIWIGKMNRIKPRVNTKDWSANDLAYLEEVRRCQTKSAIQILYMRLQYVPKVRWKDSITEILKLKQEAVG